MHYGEKALACARGCFVRMACLWQMSVWHGLAGILVLALSVLATAPSLAQVRYHYDELGRLIEVVAPDGQSAQYTYDAASNITSVKKLAATAISIAEFTPNGGPVGTTVTLYGSGFSTTPANNSVKFNGAPAAVSAATANSLTVNVPAAATTGVITVTNTNGTASSASNFVVGVTTPAPTIKNFTPDIGAPGTVVTVNGTNFQLVPEDNKAIFGSMASKVLQDASSPTATQLKLQAPSEIASGKISITTPYGKATSSTDFYVLPSTVNPADVEFKGRLTVNGAPITVQTTVAGKKAVILFEGQRGQQLHFVTSAGTFAKNISAQIYAPNGSLIETLGLTNQGVLDLARVLSGGGATGTYTVILAPQLDDKGSMTLSVVSDVVGTLTVNGSTSINLASGRNGNYTFAAEAGKGYGLGITGLTFAPTGGSMFVVLKKPDGTYLYDCTFSASDSCNFAPSLFVEAGNYLIVFDPSGSNAASFTAMVSKDTGGAIAMDAAAATTVTIAREGQNGRYTFSGTAGQSISLVWSANTLSDGNAATNQHADIVLVAPGTPGSVVANALLYENETGGNFDLTLTASGTYTVLVDPYGTLKGSVGLQVKTYAGGTLTADGPGSAITLSPGRNAQYTFSAEAGKGYGLVINNLSFAPTGGSMSVTLQTPDGTQLLKSCSFSTSGICKFSPGLFAVAGNYRLVFNPGGSNATSFTAMVSKDVGGPLTVDAATATTVNITREGQNGRYTFSGTAGQSISVVWSGNTLSDGNPATNQFAEISLAPPSNPDSAITSVRAYEDTASGSLNYTLTATGTYTVIVDPHLLKGSIGLRVTSTSGGTLTVDSAGSVINLSAGQNAQYTFAAEAGKSYGLAITGLTLTPTGSSMSVTLQKPDGAYLLDCSFSSSDSCDFPAGLFTVAGNYRLVFSPTSGSAASFTAVLSNEVIGTLTMDAPAATTVNIAKPGQNARYTFNGTAGQTISLLWSGNALSDGNAATNQWADINLASPGSPGAQLAWVPVYENAASGSLEITLTATGTHTLYLSPYGLLKGTIGLQVKTYTGDALTVNGAGTAINLDTALNREYTFAAEAGKGYGLALRGLSFTSSSLEPGVYAYLYKSDGTYLNGCRFIASDSCDFYPNLFTSTGNYKLVFALSDSDAASFTAVLSKDATGTLTVDAATATTVNIAREGQNARYTFSGTAGQVLSLVWSGNTLNDGDASIDPYALVQIVEQGGTGWPVSTSIYEYMVSGNFDFALSKTGTHTVVVTPNGLLKGSIGLRLIKK